MKGERKRKHTLSLFEAIAKLTEMMERLIIWVIVRIYSIYFLIVNDYLSTFRS